MAARRGLLKLFSFGGNRSSLTIGELIGACADTGDVGAWEEFVTRVHPVIAVSVMRTAHCYGETSSAVIEDLIQESYLKICANNCRVLRDFTADDQDAIFALIKSLACNVVHDYLRSSRALKRGAGQPEVPIEHAGAAAEPESGKLTIVEKQVLIQKVEEYLARSDVRPVERRVFWLYYRHGLTTRAIAAIPGIGLTQKGIESAIRRLTVRVREWLAEGRGRTPEFPGGKGYATPL